MYIRGLIPQNSTELAEAVPIALGPVKIYKMYDLLAGYLSMPVLKRALILRSNVSYAC